MFTKRDRNEIRVIRHERVRKKISGTPEMPRLSVYRSLNHIYVQVIDDTVGKTLVSCSTLDPQIKGQLGMVDGCKIIRVPASRLPAGCNFILTHPIACVAPTVLSEYKIHTDAPGISGWLCEGRISYDAFVLNNKKDAIFYNGAAIS